MACASGHENVETFTDENIVYKHLQTHAEMNLFMHACAYLCIVTHVQNTQDKIMDLFIELVLSNSLLLSETHSSSRSHYVSHLAFVIGRIAAAAHHPVPHTPLMHCLARWSPERAES